MCQLDVGGWRKDQLYVLEKRGLPPKCARFVLFLPINSVLLILCVLHFGSFFRTLAVNSVSDFFFHIIVTIIIIIIVTVIIINTIIIITYPLTARVVGALQMISQPVSSIFPCSPLPSGTWRTQGLMLSSHLFLCLPCLPPFIVPCKLVLSRPDEQESCPYHCSLRLLTMVRRSSCGPIANFLVGNTVFA